MLIGLKQQRRKAFNLLAFLNLDTFFKQSCVFDVLLFDFRYIQHSSKLFLMRQLQD